MIKLRRRNNFGNSLNHKGFLGSKEGRLIEKFNINEKLNNLVI